MAGSFIRLTLILVEQSPNSNDMGDHKLIHANVQEYFGVNAGSLTQPKKKTKASAQIAAESHTALVNPAFSKSRMTVF